YAVNSRPYVGSVFKLVTDTGRSVDGVTDEHPFLVLDQDTLKERWVKAKDLRKGDLVKRDFLNETSYAKTDERYTGKPLDFWWLFGLYQAEGYVRIQNNNRYPVFTVHQDERDKVVQVIKKLGYNCSVVRKGTSKGVD